MTGSNPLHVLFICSRNQWRSPTGEALFRRSPGLAVRSAGTSSKARRTVSIADIHWADLILVMEEKHSSRLRADFRPLLRFKELHVLDIPDEFHFMDPELVLLLEETAGSIIAEALDR